MQNYPKWLQDLLQHDIIDVIESDRRTVDNPGTYFGWPCDRVFNDVIGYGQADFAQGIDTLTAADKALLYAKYNQPKHLDELIDAFRQLVPEGRVSPHTTVIDLGCGPFTAGLAFAAVLAPETQFRYFGVDRAPAMLDLGAQLFDAAKSSKGISAYTTAKFVAALADIDFGKPRGDLTAVVASYLLASPSLKVAELLAELGDALERCGPGPAAVLVTNSALPHLNKKFPAFKAGLLAQGFQLLVDEAETFINTHKKPTELHYSLFYRPADTAVKLGPSP